MLEKTWNMFNALSKHVWERNIYHKWINFIKDNRDQLIDEQNVLEVVKIKQLQKL